MYAVYEIYQAELITFHITGAEMICVLYLSIKCFIMCSVDDWLTAFDARISPFVNLKVTLEEEEIVKLGKKNGEEYPLTFIHALHIFTLLLFLHQTVVYSVHIFSWSKTTVFC